MKHYFFELENKKGKLKVKPIPGQKKGTETIDESLYVQSPKSIRDEKIPIYYSDDISLSSTGKFYTVKGFNALTDDLSGIKEEYNSFMKFMDSGSSFQEKIISDPKLTPPTSSGDGFYITKDIWCMLARNVKKHINTMISGASGCGKTSCVKILCDRLGLDLHVFDMGSMIDPISSLLGVHRLEDGVSIFDYAKFTRVIQEPCVILLDEINRAPQSAMNILFPCLDDRRCLNIEVACGKGVREIKIHPEVTFIATANIGVEYSGTNSMDRALVNRFFTLELGYIPSEEEISVLMKRTGITKKDSVTIVKIATTLRNLYDKAEISVSPSIRETLSIGELISDGWPLIDAIQAVYLPLFEGTVSSGERGTVYKTITSF